MRSAVYAGSFDPVTRGHLSVIKRAAKMFDQLHVVVGVNPEKEYLFDLDERTLLVRVSVSDLSNVEVASTQGLIIDYARNVDAGFLIRGIRTQTDAASEISLANLNYSLSEEIETVLVPALPCLSEVSSSKLKEMVRAGDDVSFYCTAAVEAALRTRLHSVQLDSVKEACDAEF